MKKVTGGILMVAVMILAVSGCPQVKELVEDTFSEPRVKVREVNVTDISLKEIGLELGVEIENPNPIGLSLAGLDYNLELAGHPLTRGSFGQGLNIKASGVSPTVVPLTLVYEEIQKIYDAAEALDYLPYVLSGKVKLDTPVGMIPIPYEAKGKLPVVRPPVIKEVGVDFKEFSMSGIEAVIKINLKNPNGFDLNAHEVDYQLLLEGQDFSKGLIRDQRVAAKSSGDFKIKTSLDFGAVGSWLSKLISKGSAKYQLDYRAIYLIDDKPVRQKELNEGVVKL